MKKFLFTQNVGKNLEPFDALNHSYIRYFRDYEILPILFPTILEDISTYLGAFDIQGIILTGGNDVSPHLYGDETDFSPKISEARDRAEIKILEIAIKNFLPVLGICRGLHIINVFFGGKLIRDISSNQKYAFKHAGGSHIVESVDPDVEQLLGLPKTWVVNSFHNQGVNPQGLAQNLKALAVTENGSLIEALIHPSYPIFGIQWHPERPGSSQEVDLDLINAFLDGVFWRHSH